MSAVVTTAPDVKCQGCKQRVDFPVLSGGPVWHEACWRRARKN